MPLLDRELLEAEKKKVLQKDIAQVEQSRVITLSFQIHGIRFSGEARARNGEQALEDCLWLQLCLRKDLVHRHVKEAISFKCHRCRLSAIKSEERKVHLKKPYLIK